MADRAEGATVSLDELGGADAAAVLAGLRSAAPVSWLSAIDGWLVTGRAAAVEVMRDSERFTVEDPRFTTGQVVGPSMLSLDGEAQRRHRSPFLGPFRPRAVEASSAQAVRRRAHELVSGLKPYGRAELRTELAGPLAVSIITDALGLVDADDAAVLSWYRAIVDGVVALSEDESIPPATAAAVASLRDQVIASATVDLGSRTGLLQKVASSADLTIDELFSNTAVVMFGAIETCEGMTSNALYHLLSHPEQLAEISARPELLDRAIEESLRLEPAAAVVDRYATTDTVIGPNGAVPAEIRAGDLVRVSLLAANRDPGHFDSPDRFDIHRQNAAEHLSFVQGPHACIGAHLARLEARAAVAAVIDLLPGLTLDGAASTAPSGLVFRKPGRLLADWADE